MKPKFPAGEKVAETAAVTRLLEAAAEPVSPGRLRGIARKARRLKSAVDLAAGVLARLGHLSAAEGGKKVSLRGGA